MTRRFLCIGDIDVDLVIAVDRLPGLDEKVGGRHVALAPGGMSANVSVALARLGATVRLVGAVGDDENGRFAVERIRGEGVDVEHVVVRPDTDTFMCVVLLAPGGEKALIRAETAAYLPRPEDVGAAAFEGVDHLHLTLGDVALSARCVALARRSGIGISLDLEVADLPEDDVGMAGLMQKIDVLFVNRRTREALDRRLAGPLGPRMVITTLGACGCRLETADERIEVAGIESEAVDTTGAGDCFAAAFLSERLDRGADLRTALRFANAAAALSTRRHGAQAGAPRRREVLELLATAQEANRRSHHV